MAKRLGYVTHSRVKSTRDRKGVRGPKEWPILLWVLYPFLLVLVTQALAYGSLLNPLPWALFNLGRFLGTGVMIFTLEVGLYWLLANRWLSFSLLNGMAILIALGNRVTLSVADTGMSPNHLGIFKEMSLLENAGPGVYVAFLVLLILSLPLLYFLIWQMADWKMVFRNRFPVAGMWLLAFLLLSRLILPALTLGGEQLVSVERQGVLLYFSNGYSSSNQAAYPTEEEIQGLMEGISQEKSIPTTKPNILMVEVPGFVDLTRLTTLTQDPLPALHALSADGVRYLLDLSAVEKDNLNIEFEALCGIPVEYFPGTTQVRGGSVSPGTISLGSVLAKQGYTATAVLPYESALQQRELFYKNIGFSSLVSLEDLKVGSPEKVLQSIQGIIGDSTTPQFIYARMEVFSASYEGAASEAYQKDLVVFNGYVASLRELVVRSQKPTILVIYGSSLPVLGKDNQAYVDMGYVKSSLGTMERDARLNRGDLFLWNNYNQEADYKGGSLFDLSFLSEVLLSYGDFAMPNYLSFIRNLHGVEKVTATARDYIEKDGVLYASDSGTYKKVSAGLAMLAKDLLGPNRYVEEEKDLWSIKTK